MSDNNVKNRVHNFLMNIDHPAELSSVMFIEPFCEQLLRIICNHAAMEELNVVDLYVANLVALYGDGDDVVVNAPNDSLSYCFGDISVSFSFNLDESKLDVTIVLPTEEIEDQSIILHVNSDGSFLQENIKNGETDTSSVSYDDGNLIIDSIHDKHLESVKCNPSTTLLMEGSEIFASQTVIENTNGLSNKAIIFTDGTAVLTGWTDEEISYTATEDGKDIVTADIDLGPFGLITYLEVESTFAGPVKMNFTVSATDDVISLIDVDTNRTVYSFKK